MAAAGLWIYRSAVKKRPTGMVIYIVALTVFLVAGQAVGTDLPPRAGLIGSWLAAPPLMAAIASRLDRSV